MLEIQTSELYVNGEPARTEDMRNSATVAKTDRTGAKPKDITKTRHHRGRISLSANGDYILHLNDDNQPIVEKFANVKSVKRIIEPSGKRDAQVFPHSQDYSWNIDNFGPLTVPSKGSSVALNIHQFTNIRTHH